MANSRECLRGHASLSVFKMNFGDIRELSPVAKLRGCGASSCTKSASGTPTTWTTSGAAVLWKSGPSGAAQLDQPPALTGGPASLEHLEQPRSARGHQGKEYVLTGDESFTVAEQIAILGPRLTASSRSEKWPRRSKLFGHAIRKGYRQASQTPSSRGCG
jgi:hypothetical protein